MQDHGTRMLRVKAVAELYDVSPMTIYREIEAGRLDVVRIGKGSIRVPESALRAFEQLCAEGVPVGDADNAGQGDRVELAGEVA